MLWPEIAHRIFAALILVVRATTTECLYREPGCSAASKDYCITYQCDDTCQQISGFKDGGVPTTTWLRCKHLADNQRAYSFYGDKDCANSVQSTTTVCTAECKVNAGGAFFTCQSDGVRRAGSLSALALLLSVALAAFSMASA